MAKSIVGDIGAVGQSSYLVLSTRIQRLKCPTERWCEALWFDLSYVQHSVAGFSPLSCAIRLF